MGQDTLVVIELLCNADNRNTYKPAGILASAFPIGDLVEEYEKKFGGEVKA